MKTFLRSIITFSLVFLATIGIIVLSAGGQSSPATKKPDSLIDAMKRVQRSGIIAGYRAAQCGIPLDEFLKAIDALEAEGVKTNL